MYAVVLYESVFGNTAAVARAIAAGMAHDARVDVHFFDELESLPEGLDLLVVGGPTRGHGVNKPLARYLDHLPEERLRNVAVASFDTRLDWPQFLSGSAAHGIDHRLQKKGAHPVLAPESFLVEDRDGPLLEGELERASQWGHQLVNVIRAAA